MRMLRRNIENRTPAHSPVIAALVVLGACAGTARAQADPPRREPVPIESAPISDVRDTAGLFGAEAVAKAEEALAKLERAHHVPVVIETIDSLRGEPLADVSARHARRAVGKGLFVLIARREKKTEVFPTREYLAIFPESQKQAILLAFNREFGKDRLDEGLAQGVRAIETVLSHAKINETTPPQTQASSSALVVRDQVRLTLAGARRVVAGAEAKAAALGIKVNVAVVDDGGHLIAFARMDGARPASGYTAMTKATTAATFRQATGPITAPGASAPDPLLNLSLQNAASASGGKLTTLYGGVPITVEGQVIGGVGLGLGSGEQDAVVARAGIDEFLADLQARPNPAQQ